MTSRSDGCSNCQSSLFPGPLFCLIYGPVNKVISCVTRVGYESQGPSRAENAELTFFSKLRSGVYSLHLLG